MIWAFFEHSDILRLHKPVTDRLETLPHSIRTEYVREIPIGHNEMERNDLWLNVKGNYIFFKGKIILN